MPLIYFCGNYNSFEGHNNTIEQILSYEALFFTIEDTISCAHQPTPHCAHPLLVSLNIQQASINVDGYDFFHMEEFNSTPLPCILFYEAQIQDTCLSVGLSLGSKQLQLDGIPVFYRIRYGAWAN